MDYCNEVIAMQNPATLCYSEIITFFFAETCFSQTFLVHINSDCKCMSDMCLSLSIANLFKHFYFLWAASKYTEK